MSNARDTAKNLKTGLNIAADGTLVDFQKDGSSVGSISTASELAFNTTTGYTSLKVNSEGDGLQYSNVGTRHFGPWLSKDNAVDLGRSNGRFKDLYLSGGAYIGGTGAANKLEDYEEGTWTPTLEYNSSGATNPTISSTSNFTYVKVGQMVLITGYISISSSAKGSGSNLRITGLPFTANANYNMSAIWTASAGSPYGAYIAGSDNAINFGLLEGSSGGANSTNCPNEISVQMVYRTNA